MVKNLLNKVNSVYILKKIMDILLDKKCLNLIRYNKKNQVKLGYDINNYINLNLELDISDVFKKYEKEMEDKKIDRDVEKILEIEEMVKKIKDEDDKKIDKIIEEIAEGNKEEEEKKIEEIIEGNEDEEDKKIDEIVEKIAEENKIEEIIKEEIKDENKKIDQIIEKIIEENK